MASRLRRWTQVPARAVKVDSSAPAGPHNGLLVCPCCSRGRLLSLPLSQQRRLLLGKLLLLEKLQLLLLRQRFLLARSLQEGYHNNAGMHASHTKLLTSPSA